MRNLKRALSLALASVMLVGMMVVGTSAASYPDVDETHNVEAIDVLNAVEVMIGRQGNFEPTEAVNRHEMAVIMAKLVLGVETADNYVGTHPFTDVVPWADKYVAACYENGLVAGTSATTFSGSKNLTAVQAAAMMLRALGYKDLSKGATDWRAPVTATANQIRLFNGVASNPSELLNRNQVAQLALNTLKSPIVDMEDGTFDISDGDGKIIVTGGSRRYVVRSSNEAYARAINRTEIAGTSSSSVSGWTVELGEHLYNGKLHLNYDVDAFGRPSRVWEYDGKDVGTYIRDELLRDQYTVKVKGSEVYDDLGTISIKESDLEVYVDGVLGNTITKNELARTWTKDLAPTGKGALTQVFYDQEEKVVTITVINTYLAKGVTDYNEKTDRGSLDVYGFDNSVGVNAKKVRQPAGAPVNTVANYSNVKKDNLAEIVNLKEGEFYLVTIADGALQSLETPEIMQDVKLTSINVASWVNTGSQKYDFSAAYDYDFEHVLTTYDKANMEHETYNLYFDKYGYVVGADLFEGAKNYVFITGYDRNGSNIYDSTITANAIFADGTMKTIKVNAKKSDPSLGGTTWKTGVPATDAQQWTDPSGEGVITNKWYTYSVTNDVYTLKLATQVWDDGDTVNHGDKIDAARNGLNGIYGGNNGKDVTVPAGYYTNGVPRNNEVRSTAQWVYGDTDTNYIIVDPTDDLLVMNRNGGKKSTGITGVTAVVTGVRNVDVDVLAKSEATGQTNMDTTAAATYGAYAVYDSNYHVVAAVVIGVDNGNTGNYVYLTKGTPNQESIRNVQRADNTDGTWYWEFDAITKDEGLTTVTMKGTYGDLVAFKNNYDKAKGLYTFSVDADGYLKSPKVMAADVNGVYSTGWDAGHEDVAKVASNPDEIVYKTMSDSKIVSALGWATTNKLYVNGRTLNDTDNGNMRGVHLAPNAKIFTNLKIDGSWVTTEYTNLSSAVSNMTYNDSADNASTRVYAILNSNGEADVLVIEVAKDMPTSAGGDYGDGKLRLNGLSIGYGSSVISFTNKTGNAIYSANADVEIYEGGKLVWVENTTNIRPYGGIPNNGYGTIGINFGIFGNANENKVYTAKVTLHNGDGKDYTGTTSGRY